MRFRRTTAWILAALALLAVAVPLGRNLVGGDLDVDPRDPLVASDRGKLIVHEWGTFTNFAGADGVQLDFRPLVDNELPPFVTCGWTSRRAC
jgi:hypothetical protein